MATVAPFGNRIAADHAIIKRLADYSIGGRIEAQRFLDDPIEIRQPAQVGERGRPVFENLVELLEQMGLCFGILAQQE